MRKLVLLLLAAGMFSGTSLVYADPAVIIYFSNTNACFDQDGNILATETIRKLVMTNDDEGTVNVTAKGTCPTTAPSAVYWDYLDFPGLGCDAGVAGAQPYWKYHMQPDGDYTLKCQSHPFED